MQPIIEYNCFMNWLQNHCPAIYVQYWAMIEPAEGGYCPVNFQPDNAAIIKKWD